MRSRTLILAFAGAVLVAVASLHIADLWWRRDAARRSAETRATSQARALTEYVRGGFAAVDAALRQLTLYAPRIGGATGSSADWQPILDAAQASLNERGSLSVVDATGIIRHSTLKEIVGQSRRESFLFQHLSQNDPDELTVDVFLANRLPDRPYLLPVGRRLETRDGAFDGMVVQVVTPDAFRGFFRTVRIGAQGAIWVFHPTGLVLFREPSATDPLGENAAENPLLQTALQSGGNGTYYGPITPGGPPYISAYNAVDNPRVIVGVAHSESETLADWRRDLGRSGFEMTGLALVMGVLLVIVFRQMRARTHVERTLADVQRTEAQRLREANDRLEAALLREMQAREETETASRLKDEFLMTLSHELRTPLNAILGWTHMLSTNNIPPEQRDRALATIERNASAQAHLIEGLLDVSRAISGKLQLNLRMVSVADAVTAAIDTLRPAMSAKGIAFEMAIDEGLAPIHADPDRLQQIVWNLLSNAIKFTPKGGTVSVRVAAADDAVEIVVHDTGTGITPEFLPHVFDRFRQADAGLRREHGGLGLGLAIARHLVELHGGTIAAESEGEGTGATFRVVLPVHHASAEAATRGSSPPLQRS